MTKKGHQKFLWMKIGKISGKRFNCEKFPESEIFSKIGGNLKQGGKCIMVSEGMDAPGCAYFYTIHFTDINVFPI